MGASVPEIVRETVRAVKDLGGGFEDDAVTIKAVGKKLGLGYSATHRRVSLALDGGYLNNLEDRPKRPAKLIAGDPLPKDEELLPDPEKLGDEEPSEPDVSTYLANPEGRDAPPPFPVEGGQGAVGRGILLAPFDHSIFRISDRSCAAARLFTRIHLEMPLRRRQDAPKLHAARLHARDGCLFARPPQNGVIADLRRRTT